MCANPLTACWRHAPQFQPVDDPSDRFNNLAAVAVLQAPDWATPVMKQYSAVLPRPEVRPNGAPALSVYTRYTVPFNSLCRPQNLMGMYISSRFLSSWIRYMFADHMRFDC